MQHYLEGYVRARQTLADIERRPQETDEVPDRPDARALERWLGHVAATVRRAVAVRPAPPIRAGSQTPARG